jgi:hypothetical protein
MRWVSLLVRPFVRLSVFLATKAVLILAVVAVSLSISMASFVVPTLASAMWRAAAWVFGPPVVATVAETQGIRKKSQALQRRNQELQQTNERQARANRVLRTDNQRLASDNKLLRERHIDYRRVTASTARQVGHRAVRSSTRSIAAIPLESVPFLGVTTIIATTAWEIRDTCNTLDDMAEIQRHLGQEPDKSFAARACDDFPLQDARLDHYGNMPVSECRANAEAARDRVFELANQARDEVPDLLADDSVFDAEVVQAANDEFEAINVICDCIADLLCDPENLARR